MKSHKHKFIFVHIPKTGGTSVRESLRQYCPRTRTPWDWWFPRLQEERRHEPIRGVINEKTNKYFKFAFVRNPWDRVVSAYFYRVRRNHKDLLNALEVDTARLKGDLAYKRIPFGEWVRNTLEIGCRDRHGQVSENVNQVVLREQIDWILDSTNQVQVNFIGKFENLQKDFDTICDKIGVPREYLPHINATNHKHYSEYYDDETREIVAKKYANDIKHFGYEYGQ